MRFKNVYLFLQSRKTEQQLANSIQLNQFENSIPSLCHLSASSTVIMKPMASASYEMLHKTTHKMHAPLK